MSNRQLVSRNDPRALQNLAVTLQQTVRDLTKTLTPIFNAYVKGDAGKVVDSITESLFSRWCSESGTAPIERVAEEMNRAVKKQNGPDLFRILLIERNFPVQAASEVADELASLARNKKWNSDRLFEALWHLYGAATEKMMAQTAHVVVARALLYRIAEDTGSDAFPIRLSGDPLAKALQPGHHGLFAAAPSLALFDQMRLIGESVLPTVYRLGEFDWWYIPADKRSALGPAEKTRVHALDHSLGLAFQRMFRVLEQYQFEDVDVDVWRNVYQHFLPREERQRLGGFYTPDEIVETILDEVGYVSRDAELANKRFIDPACGSGAFVVGALSRLLAHFTTHPPSRLPPGKQPQWLRDQYELEAVQHCVHAIDMHPFAAFLTTINVLFLVLPRYIRVRAKNPQFTFEPFIVCHDALFTTATETQMSLAMQSQINGRVERAAQDAKQYIELLKKEFDFVIGNPPWSGILKGPMAAVYDELQKRRLRDTYSDVATGKYDIYALFMARAIRMLRKGGALGFVTQDTFLDKDWAGGIRYKLCHETTLKTLVDLNPFGGLFFEAMNTPFITICEATPPSASHNITVLSASRPSLADVQVAQRRQYVREDMAEILDNSRDIEKTSLVKSGEVFDGFKLPQKSLMAAGMDRWHLAPVRATTWPALANGVHVSELLEVSQGVTTGGKGCLALFLMTNAEAQQSGIEPKLLHRAIKGLHLDPYATPFRTRALFYPYVDDGEHSRPAFNLRAWKAKQREGLSSGIRLLEDALDFTHQIDEVEERIVQGGGLNVAAIEKILRHREALGLIAYPEAARVLVKHYVKLEGRILKKKNIREFNRQWYEYIWPRDPSIMLRTPKLISPRLTRKVRFALDTTGVIPQDSCIVLAPSERTQNQWGRFIKQLATAAGRLISETEAFKVVLAFLNSDLAQRTLVTGRKKTPKGSYTVTDDYFADIVIPNIKTKEAVTLFMDEVDVLRDTTKASQHEAARKRIDKRIARLIDNA